MTLTNWIEFWTSLLIGVRMTNRTEVLVSLLDMAHRCLRDASILCAEEPRILSRKPIAQIPVFATTDRRQYNYSTGRQEG